MALKIPATIMIAKINNISRTNNDNETSFYIKHKRAREYLQSFLYFSYRYSVSVVVITLNHTATNTTKTTLVYSSMFQQKQQLIVYNIVGSSLKNDDNEKQFEFIGSLGHVASNHSIIIECVYSFMKDLEGHLKGQIKGLYLVNYRAVLDNTINIRLLKKISPIMLKIRKRDEKKLESGHAMATRDI